MRLWRAKPEPPRRSVELHCHALPGLDDGPSDLGESLEMCRRYSAEGVGTVVVTPHLFHPGFQVAPQAIRDKTLELQAACERQGIPVAIRAGAEVSLTPELLEHARGGDLLTLAEGKHLLLELPVNAAPPLQDTVFQLGLRGLTVLLAHPERNQELQREPERLGGLVAGGCFAQISAGSLLGLHGASARKAAEEFVLRGLAHIVASDAHGAQDGGWPDFGECVRELIHLVGPDEARTLVSLNPERILAGKPIVHPSRYHR